MPYLYSMTPTKRARAVISAAKKKPAPLSRSMRYAQEIAAEKRAAAMKLLKKRAASRATAERTMRATPNIALKKLMAGTRTKVMTHPEFPVGPIDPEKARYESYAKAHDLMRRADLIRALYTAERELEIYRHKYDATMEGRVKAVEEKLAWVSK